MLSELNFQMEAGSLNQIYDKIINCKVVKPPYEWVEWIYNKDFFLDKRDWLEFLKEDTLNTYTDIKKINWVNHYLFNNWSSVFVWVERLTWWINTITTWEIIVNWSDEEHNSPIKMVRCYWPNWQVILSWWITWATVGSLTTSWDTVVDSQEWNTTEWVKITSTNINSSVVIGWYIQFNSWILKWNANKIYRVDLATNSLYIIWTNYKGSLPLIWDTFKIYWQSHWENILVGTKNGLTLYNTNWENIVTWLQWLVTWEILDIETFDWVIFVLTNTTIYFSRKKFDENTWFYPLDKFSSNGATKLINVWKTLLAIWWWINKAYSKTKDSNWLTQYIESDIDYQWELFSKYSYIFSDSTFYILQKDKQLVQIEIVSVSELTFNMVAKNIQTNTRWLFESITTWNVITSENDRFLNFINIEVLETWKLSTIYQYDKQYNHWLIDKIEYDVYFYWDRTWINWWVAKKSSVTKDIIKEYKQEINFMVNEKNKIILPYLVRTNFWLTWTALNVDLDIEFTEWSLIRKINKNLNNYSFDNLLNELSIEDMVWDTTWTVYNWNTVSIQHNIMRSWRFFKMKYSSLNRFIIGESYIPYKKSKYYINEILQTN